MSNMVPALSGGGAPMQIPDAAGNGLSGMGSPAPGSALMGQSAQTIGSIQTGSSVLDGLMQMGADQSKASSYQIQAGEWGTQAKDEFVMGTNQVSNLKNQYLNAIGTGTTRMAAGGLDVGQGAGAQSRTTIGQNAATAEQNDMLASDIRARRDAINQIQANAAADQANLAAKLALVGGFLNTGAQAMSAGTAGG
ncbi:MAG: hypothetical protein WAU78_10500 [Roseiarcus sp.]